MQLSCAVAPGSGVGVFWSSARAPWPAAATTAPRASANAKLLSGVLSFMSAPCANRRPAPSFEILLAVDDGLESRHPVGHLRVQAGIHIGHDRRIAVNEIAAIVAVLEPGALLG